MSSCGDLGHFPQLVLQNNEPVSWWLEQICQAHGGSEVKPPDSSHEEHKSLASPIAPEGRICVLHEGQCSRSLGTHEKWSFKKAEWGISRFVNLDKPNLQLQDHPCISRNKEPPDVSGRSPSGIKWISISKLQILLGSDSRQGGR